MASKARDLYSFLFIAFTFVLIIHSCQRVVPTDAPAREQTWQEVLENDLHLLGHRNWILVVDKAFPEQSSPGMKYIYADQELLPTLEYVLKLLESSTHVTPILYRDKELNFIAEEQAPGISSFRTESELLLEGQVVNTMLHDEVFTMLDESSSLFRTLVIKTNATLPYTSVFMKLDCAYWNPENEQKLRQEMLRSGE